MPFSAPPRTYCTAETRKVFCDSQTRAGMPRVAHWNQTIRGVLGRPRATLAGVALDRFCQLAPAEAREEAFHRSTSRDTNSVT
jgi:hypothetical protein